MSFNGSGTFLINSAGQPVVANTVISATVFNALTADLATGLTTCITKDGQTTPTANIPMGGNKITGLAVGTLATDAANLSQVQSTAVKLITPSGVDTITGTMSPVLTAYAAGQMFYFVAAGANTGPVTLNIDGLGAKAVTRDGASALAAGDINSGEIVVVVYDGTRFQMVNAANSFGNTTINGTLTVTGNTGLQANVSITSTLSVGGTFAVTGAATLGNTLAVTGKSDLPTVSTASINAAVALITTGTVTNLTASGASIASANIGNLQFTAASIASINAGVAVITNLTATGASIASANVGTAVITTGTVTNLTSTSASVASINAAVALITTGTVTALTATGASVASANVGTAVVTGLTVTNASIASLNAGTATVTNGNLTFSSTAQRITGDFSNATFSSRLAFQSSTTNGNTTVNTLPNGTATTSQYQSYNAADPTNSSLMSVGVGPTEMQLQSAIRGTGTYLPMTFYTGGSERMRLDTSGLLGLGNTVASTINAVNGVGNLVVGSGSGSEGITIYTGTADTGGIAFADGTNTTDTYRGYINYAHATDHMAFWTSAIERMRISSDGSVGIGTASPTANLEVGGSGNKTLRVGTTSNSYAYLNLNTWALDRAQLRAEAANPSAGSGTGAGKLTIWTANAGSLVERMAIDGDGNVGIGGTAQALTRVDVVGTLPTSSNQSEGIRVIATIPSGSTTGATMFGTWAVTQAASFTLSSLIHFKANQQTLGAGSAITNQYGFYADAALTGATNNYGFYSDIASGSNRWNFYAAGTAQNYFAGDTLIGATSALNSARLTVDQGTTNATTYTTVATRGGSLMTQEQQSTTSVSTSAVTILTPTNPYASLCLVFGSDGTNRFIDLVLFALGTGTVNVISSLSAAGTPAARTYSQSSSTYRVAMASGTYTVQVTALGMGT